MLNDTLANALSKIKAYETVRKRECLIFPSSKTLKKLLEILNDHRFIGEFKEFFSSRGCALQVNLLGNINDCNVIKPRFAVKADNFEKFEKRYLPAKDIGILIISTPEGIISHNEAKEKRIGGRLIAYCY